MNNPPFHAFTYQANGRLREIITDIGVSLPMSPDNVYETKALWDTGATNCVVTVQTAKQLNLKPISVSKVSHAGGESFANVYLVDIYLPNRLMIQNVRVTECADSTGSFGMIIGMDVITNGDFSVTNYGNNTTVSFRIPSVKTIDYVREANDLTQAQFKHVGRNDICPCGSKLKYKNCHGKN